MAEVPNVALNNAVLMPQVGFGVFLIPDDQTTEVVTTALKTGYRHIDTAAIYENEAGVGAALKNTDIAREDIFVTTKVWNSEQGYDQATRAFSNSLARLGLDYIDLYLIHWPIESRGTFTETWRALQDLYGDSQVRAIGVSNFQVRHLQTLLDEFNVVPAVNQIELHPYLSQDELRAFHAAHGIATEAWAPLAKGKALLSDPLLTELAGKHGKTVAQVVIRWHVQLGNVVIPKSVTPSRIVENFDVFDFELTDAEVESITALNRNERTGPNPDVFGN